MKNTPSKPSAVKLKPSEIIAKISASQKRLDLAKKKALEAKVVFKRSRKIYKLVKKAAKAARADLKDLKKLLKASKAAASRAKTVAARKSSKARKPSPAKAAAILPAPVPPAVVAEVAVPTDAVGPQS